jgi:hypothetical protein
MAEIKEFNCITCNYSTNKHSDWIKHEKTQKHLRNGKQKITKCDKCDYSSHSHWNVKLHNMSQHSTLEERKTSKYYCITCDYVFFCPTYLNKHMNGKHHMNKVNNKSNIKIVL